MVNDAMIAAVVSSAALVAGAAAASIPIIIHLLSRRRFRRVRWAAMEWLLEAERENRRRMRVEQWILLALRCLAMFLVGLLLSRWYVQPKALAAVLGGAGRTDRFVVLDDSFSMGYRADAGVVFEAARESVLRIARWVQQESPQDSLTIIAASRPDQPIVRGAVLREMSLEELRSQLGRLEPSQRGPCVATSLAAVRRTLDARPEAINAAVYVISDFQATDWAGENPLASLGNRSDAGKSLEVVLVDVGLDETENICVSSLEIDQRQIPAGVPARFMARITNYGRREASPEPLRSFVGEASQPPVSVPTIPPGQSVNVPIELTIAAAGPTAVSVELPHDRLAADDRRHLAVEVQRSVQVLLVDGEPDADAFRDEATLLAAAIRPEGPVYSGNDVEIIEENRLDDINLDGYDVIVLANVYRISESAAAQLERFTEVGGGAVFFSGDQIDTELYNRVLYRDGVGLLPARLLDRVRSPASEKGYGFAQLDMTHPLFRHFADADVPYFDGIFTREFLGIAASGAGSRPATASAPTSRPAAGVLLTYNDADRRPAIVERGFGRGRVVLFAGSADKEWTNLPDYFTFVVLMQDLVQYVARPGEAGVGVLAGSPIVIDLESGRYDPQATLRTPAFPQEPDVSLEARADGPGGSLRLIWSNTDQAGVYRFGLKQTGGGPVTRLAVVNVDPRESNLAHCSRERLRESAGTLPVRYVRGEDVTGEQALETRNELWPAVLVLLLVVLVAEQALAWWFGSRFG